MNERKDCLMIKMKTIMKTNFNIQRNIRNSRSIGLIVAALLIGNSQVWGTDYVLVKNISNLSAGDHVLIVNTDYSKALGTQQNSNNRTAIAVTISSETISSPGSTVQVLTLGKSGDYWTFYSPSPTTGYLYAASSSGNQLKTQGTNNANGEWEIAINTTTGLASVVASQSSNHNVMQYNNGSSIFSCYSSASQSGVYIFKEAASGFTVDFAVNNSGYGSVFFGNVTLI